MYSLKISQYYFKASPNVYQTSTYTTVVYDFMTFKYPRTQVPNTFCLGEPKLTLCSTTGQNQTPILYYCIVLLSCYEDPMLL